MPLLENVFCQPSFCIFKWCEVVSIAHWFHKHWICTKIILLIQICTVLCLKKQTYMTRKFRGKTSFGKVSQITKRRLRCSNFIFFITTVIFVRIFAFTDTFFKKPVKIEKGSYLHLHVVDECKLNFEKTSKALACLHIDSFGFVNFIIGTQIRSFIKQYILY